MKRLFAILLLFCITFINVKECSMYLLYEINKPYIADNLCENRSVPELQCEGQCFLDKNLQKESNNEVPHKYEEIQKLVMIQNDSTEFAFGLYGKMIMTFFNMDEKVDPSILEIFHPPSV